MNRSKRVPVINYSYGYNDNLDVHALRIKSLNFSVYLKRRKKTYFM